ncbi:SRPBCC family protein [Lysobacter sp. K5869]|uniref:SRPBCC family protein n=1 Tax=Lysobacter sp. K5869 TaxID=2820808 RepID=UPI001C06488E|nr:SRPBCC family protein [Lysobacter sp. K5869]QWP77428.1 SRPBCC family protein [Lysobacter sp. K5869]
MSANTLKVAADGDTAILVVREFDAPRELVFEAWTRPDLLKRWLGVFGGWSLDECEIDLRPGGAYRYLWRNGDTAMGVRGVYTEVLAPERIVGRERFDEAWFAGDALGTTTFVERDGRTRISNRIEYASREIRDGVLQSPMETGMGLSYDALEALLAERKAA